MIKVMAVGPYVPPETGANPDWSVTLVIGLVLLAVVGISLVVAWLFESRGRSLDRVEPEEHVFPKAA